MASHAGVRLDADVKQALEEASGCGALHAALESCLADAGRDWRACQLDVRALKRCTEQVRAAKAAAVAAAPRTRT